MSVLSLDDIMDETLEEDLIAVSDSESEEVQVAAAVMPRFAAFRSIDNSAKPMPIPRFKRRTVAKLDEGRIFDL